MESCLLSFLFSPFLLMEPLSVTLIDKLATIAASQVSRVIKYISNGNKSVSNDIDTFCYQKAHLLVRPIII